MVRALSIHLRPDVRLNRLVRPLSLAVGLGYAAAALLALDTILIVLHQATVGVAGLCAAVAAALVYGSYFISSIGTELESRAQRSQTRADLVQAELDQQRNAIDNLADGLDVAMFICDARGIILYANRRSQEIFNAGEMVGKTILAGTLSFDLEQLAKSTATLRQPQHAELTFKHPTERVGLAKAWTQDTNDRVFLSIYEITELRRLERIRQDFVANVSHELRTPMTVIRAFAETLLDNPETYEEKGTTYLDRIIAEVDRLTLITNDLLVLSTAESNMVKKQVIDLAPILDTVILDLQSKASDKGLVLTAEVPEECVIQANEAQMTQVVMNLIENALNYTVNGSVHAELTCSPYSATLEITDTGIGISSEQLPRIFERFYRVDKGRSRGTGGTGLGLSIVKHIVDAHSGSVSVQSRLNVGTKFVVKLPVGDVTADGF